MRYRQPVMGEEVLVADGDEEGRFHIYVIELPKRAATDAKLIRDNPDYVPGKGCLYVGHTHKSVEERFEDHRLKRPTGADITRKYGVVRLRPDLSGSKYALSRPKAEELEEKLARKLRAQGYAVRQA